MSYYNHILFTCLFFPPATGLCHLWAPWDQAPVCFAHHLSPTAGKRIDAAFINWQSLEAMRPRREDFERWKANLPLLTGRLPGGIGVGFWLPVMAEGPWHGKVLHLSTVPLGATHRDLLRVQLQVRGVGSDLGPMQAHSRFCSAQVIKGSPDP